LDEIFKKPIKSDLVI